MSSKAYFDDIASDWEAIRSDFFSEAVREKALHVGGVTAGQIAADVGAGSGFITEALLRAGAKVIAIDQSEVMLDQLRARFPGARVETRVGEAESLPLEAASVDYAFANMFLHHVENPAATIKAMARTLKPGGKLIITDLDEHTHEFLREEQHDRWLGFKRESIAAWFGAAGLTNVAVSSIDDEQCCASCTCSSERAEINIFVASGEKVG
jgi:ubiquinone/menaquinone biosynthesis C-methylase UbiE